MGMLRRTFLKGVASLALAPRAQARPFLTAIGAGGPNSGGAPAPPSTITLVGTATGANSATVPAHIAGDLIIIAAFRNTTGTPSLPSGFLSILTKTGTTASLRVGYKIATGTSDTSGTWTNATALVCHVYRAPSGYTMGIGASASAASTTNTINYPALTLADASGNSWAAGFVGNSTITNTIATPPSGMTNESHEAAAATQAAGHDTEGGVTSWSSTNATTSGTPGDSVSATVELMMVPKGSALSFVFQHVGGGGNPNSNYGQTSSKNYVCPLPNVSGAGNCLVLGLTYDHAAGTPTVSDNINGTWGAATVSANGGTGNQDSGIWVFPNTGSGQITINVAFGTATASFQYQATELHKIATTSPGAGSTSTAFTAGPGCSAGSFTPTNNDSTGGNIIWSYNSKSVAFASAAAISPRAVAGAGFTMLTGNIANNTAVDNQNNAAQMMVQTSHAAINPTVFMVGDNDTYNSLAVALKVNSGSGTAPASGIRLNSIQHFATVSFPTSGTFPIQVSATGNLRVIVCDDPALNSLTITDSEGNSYLSAVSGAGIWYAANTTFNQNLLIYVTGGGGDAALSWRFADVSGAAASPFDTAVITTNNPTGTSFTANASPSPSSAIGLSIANIGLGQGPGLSVTAPAGSIWDLCTYTGETDIDLIENADIMAHLNYSSAGSQTWGFTCKNSTSCSGGIACFHQ